MENENMLQFTDKASQQKIFRIRVELEDIKPEIFRVLLVKADIGLDLLHAILQVSIGWTNSHLHQFHIGKRRFSDLQFDMNEDLMDPSDYVHDESEVVLATAFKTVGSKFTYEYDFGDSWRHRITVEDIVPDDGGINGFAQCVDGKRACPPEDCGGVWGYADFLDIVSNPGNEEYDSTLEWVGGSFDPEAFDIEKVNRFLRKLKWEHPTVEQLARVLMARDAVRSTEPVHGKTSATATVLSVIKKSKKGISIDEIMKQAGLTRQTVNGVLARMKKEGKVKTAERGIYLKA